MLAQQGDRLREDKIAREGCYGERLLRDLLPRQPGIRNITEFVDHRVEVSRQNHLELEAIALSSFQGIAQAGSARAVEVETSQADMRRFADLQELQPGIEVEREGRGGNLIKSSAFAVSVGKFDKAPHQFRPLFGRTDRISERGPGSPALCEHQERFARIGKQETLITHKCKQGI